LRQAPTLALHCEWRRRFTLDQRLHVPQHRRGHGRQADSIAGAKTDETRQRRLEKTLAELRG
jgi:hypothetical protein